MEAQYPEEQHGSCDLAKARGLSLDRAIPGAPGECHFAITAKVLMLAGDSVTSSPWAPCQLFWAQLAGRGPASSFTSRTSTISGRLSMVLLSACEANPAALLQGLQRPGSLALQNVRLIGTLEVGRGYAHVSSYVYYRFQSSLPLRPSSWIRTQTSHNNNTRRSPEEIAHASKIPNFRKMS